MDLYVLSPNFDRIALIEDYESVIWNIRYFDVGDFELYISATSENLRLLKKSNYIVRDKDIVSGKMHNVMCIETVEINTDSENGDFITATGRDLKSIVARRIIWRQTIVSGYVEIAIRQLIIDNLINPSIQERKIENVVLGEIKGFTDTMRQQVTGDNLQEYITSVLTTYGIGWECVLNENRQICIDFFKGADRSIAQNDNPHITFSPENENILNSDYKMDYKGYKNVALVAGEGEGLNRKTAAAGTANGINRYEVYIDSRDASSNEGEIDDTAYYAQLTQKGNEELKKTNYTESFEGEIEPYANYVYGVDYNLGDTVTVTNLYNVTANPRIIGVIESFSDNGESTIPTFSTWISED